VRTVNRFSNLLVTLWLCVAAFEARGACSPCLNYAPGVAWGIVEVNALSEASGIAASARNPGVLWTHNDGSRKKVFALDYTGALLATFNLDVTVSDVEDIAVGRGPVAGVSYLYLGDIGGSAGTNTVRGSVRVLRSPEPAVDRAWKGDPRSEDLAGTETFTLAYPDGSFDAETLLVDPLTGDLLIVTKQTGSARVYRTNLAGLTNGSTVTLQFVRAVSFSQAAGGDISADGTRIALRREDAAMVWGRCDAEPIGTALARSGQTIPVIGPPTEPNGEAIAFLREGTGYVTISEGNDPTLYFFQSLCPTPPSFLVGLSNQSEFAGGVARFEVVAVGYPPPVYRWRQNGGLLAGQTNATLLLSNLTALHAGLYQLTVSNASGVITNTATLTVRAKPDLRITEVQSNPTSGGAVETSDWWELTSFESQPVDLSGWRFNDAADGLSGVYVIADGVTIAPGESLIFAEGLSRAKFRMWWGTSNVASTVQVISYSGNGLSLGAGGDGLRLWNNTATDPSDTVASVDFGAADVGVTFNFDPGTGQFGGKSRLGINGVFRAGAAADIGSPGRILAPLIAPRLLSRANGANVRIEFDALAGHVYHLEISEVLQGGFWAATGDSIRATNNGRAYFEKVRSGGERFFRVRAE
jgi:hypothetical protein